MDPVNVSQLFGHTQKKTWYRNLTILYFIVYTGIKTLFIFSGYNLFSEEAQYWLWSRFPDWSYYSKPPMIAWVNFLSGFLGHHDSIIRFTALMFGLGALYMMYKLVMLLFHEERIALLSTILLSVSPYFVLASTFFTTDSLLIFFWIVTGFFFTSAIQNDSLKDWILAGLFFGLGCLSKYSMFFFLVAFIPFGFSRHFRGHYRGIACFLIIGAIMFTPVVFWNYRHDWVTFKHVSALSFDGNTTFSVQNSLYFLSEYLGGVLLVNSPFLLLVFYKSGDVLKEVSVSKNKDEQILLWLMLPVVVTILFFFTLSIFKRTEVNWGAMGYTSIPIVLAYITHKTASYSNALRMSGITLLIVSILLFPLVIDRIGFSGILPLRIDSMKRMAGWQQLSVRVSALQKQYPEPTVILTDNYHVASEIAFYGKVENLYCVNMGRRMNQFDIWHAGLGIYKRGNRALYVTELAGLPDTGLNFESVDAHYTFPIIYRGKVIRTFNIFILKNFTGWPNNHFSEF